MNPIKRIFSAIYRRAAKIGEFALLLFLLGGFFLVLISFLMGGVFIGIVSATYGVTFLIERKATESNLLLVFFWFSVVLLFLPISIRLVVISMNLANIFGISKDRYFVRIYSYFTTHSQTSIWIRILLPPRLRNPKGVVGIFWDAVTKLTATAKINDGSRELVSQRLAELEAATVNVRDVRLSVELSHLCRCLGSMILCEDSRDIARMSSYLSAFMRTDFSTIKNCPALFPPIAIECMTQVADIGIIVAGILEKNIQINTNEKLAILTNYTHELKEYVALMTDYPDPMSVLLLSGIGRWLAILNSDHEQLRAALGASQVPSPYVIGNPVRGSLFVGREDILQALQLRWGGQEQCASIVLYGHRRMGKTSILKNLETLNLPQPFIVVDFNMHLVGHVDSTGELLHNMAIALCDAARRRNILIEEPPREIFLNRNAYQSLGRFLDELQAARQGYLFIVTIDEFELIEERIKDGRLDGSLLRGWRAMFQSYPWLTLVFAGLHSLEEMCRDYWHPLFGSVYPIEVGFLMPGAARQLIAKPTPDFPLSYTPDAIEEIIRLTNGQPYLIQIVCDGLVSRYNQQLSEPGLPPPRRLTVQDVQSVVDAPQLFSQGAYYFEGVWRHAGEIGSELAAILSTLARAAEGMSSSQLALLTGLSAATLQPSLEALRRRDVVRQEGEQYRIAVELMRRWIVERQAETTPNSETGRGTTERAA